MAWYRAFRRILILFTASRWSHLCSAHCLKCTVSAWYGGTVWGTIGYMSWPSLICIVGTLNSARYISVLLRCAGLPFIRVLWNATFQQDNARPMLLALFSPTFMQKMFSICPGLHKLNSVTFRKHLINSSGATDSSHSDRHYCRWTVASYWSWMGSCTYTCQSISIRLNAVIPGRDG